MKGKWINSHFKIDKNKGKKERREGRREGPKYITTTTKEGRSCRLGLSDCPQ